VAETADHWAMKVVVTAFPSPRQPTKFNNTKEPTKNRFPYRKEACFRTTYVRCCFRKNIFVGSFPLQPPVREMMIDDP
jgi:hypothetical protein